MVERSLGQNVSKFELGGAEMHLRESGAIDNGGDSEEDIVDQIKRFLSYMPKNVHELPPRLESQSDDPPERLCERLLEIMPNHPRRAFDPRALINEIFDRESFFEIGPGRWSATNSGRRTRTKSPTWRSLVLRALLCRISRSSFTFEIQSRTNRTV